MKTLDPTVPQDVNYCIPLWVRDLQVKEAITRVKGRLLETSEVKDEPIAIVCYGPSLLETWEKIKDFKTIMTCSGAHKFLVEKGIIPTYHVEVDPRPHKVKLIGPPQEATEYLIASACHQNMFDHLEGFNVKLWHIFGVDEDAMRLLPPDEWALTGGCSAGLRCLVLARFMGYRDLHIFGMDGSAGANGLHAAEHPNQSKDTAVVTVNGKEFHTTAGFLEAARSTGREIDMLRDVTATFYGEGLTQELMKNHIKVEKKDCIIGVQKPAVISAAYQTLNEQLHKANAYYGTSGAKHAKNIIKLTEALKTTSVLDYGCGKGQLALALPFPIWEYDPAIPGKNEMPRAADIVVCSDVLEHIEPDRLHVVLDDLRRVTRKVGYFVINTGPAQKTLPDGRNTHLIQKNLTWWTKTLAKFFIVGKIHKDGNEVYAVVAPLEKAYKQFAIPKKVEAVAEAA